MTSEAGDSSRREGADGLATIWAASWMLLLSTVAGVGLVLGFAVARQHQVEAAADLTALSAASRLQHGGDACATAGRVARANRVELHSCRVAGSDVLVVVRTRLDLPFGLSPVVSGAARAGPG